MTIDKNIVFFGTENYSVGPLKALIDAGYPISAVITKADAPSGRGQQLTEPPIKTFANLHNIPVWQPDKVSDINQQLANLQPVVGILVAYGKIIPQSTIDLFSPGIINVHPSLLPRWRGPSPIEAAIANRDSETGVTLIQLNAKMDAGPIYAQKKVPLNFTETKPELYGKLFSLGSDMLIESLPDILSDTLQPTPQTDEGLTFCSLLSKSTSLLNPDQMTALEAEAHVRAHLSYPRSKVQISDHLIIITKAHVSNQPNGKLAVQFNDGKYLVIDELIAPSGKTMGSDAFRRGYLANR